MGFTYAPAQDSAEYWRHGGPKRTLLICCKAYNSKDGAFDNLTIRKISLAVLSKCEWGRDDYSLRVANLPPAPEPEIKPEPARSCNAQNVSQPLPFLMTKAFDHARN